MAGDNVFNVGGADWQTQVLDSDVPVLVDFWAAWCGPCKAIAPILEELAGEWDGKIKVAKVDVDSNPDLANQFSVRSIPTLLLVKDGEVVDKMMGASPKGSIKEKFEAHI